MLMTKFGQAEFAEFLAEIFMKDKLDQMLESAEKKIFSRKNTEDIYRELPSSRDAVQSFGI